jgi:hypothetical protein
MEGRKAQYGAEGYFVSTLVALSGVILIALSQINKLVEKGIYTRLIVFIGLAAVYALSQAILACF